MAGSGRSWPLHFLLFPASFAALLCPHQESNFLFEHQGGEAGDIIVTLLRHPRDVIMQHAAAEEDRWAFLLGSASQQYVLSSLPRPVAMAMPLVPPLTL